MRRGISLFVLVLTAIPICVAQKPEGLASARPQTYELYSWREANGIWNFSVLPSPSGVDIPTETVFAEKFALRGVDKLRRKISALPSGSKVLWMDRISASKSSQAPGNTNLAYPPASIVEQVKRYAQKKRIEVKILSVNPLGP